MIVGRVGLIGNGKTYLHARDALATAKRRRAVFLSNIWTRGSVPAAAYLGDPGGVDRVQLAVGDDGFDLAELEELLDAARGAGRGAVLFIDEVGVLMPARFWQKFPVALMYRFSQSRKLRLDVYYTAQDIEDVDSFLRRKTQWVYRVRAWPTPTVERQERGQRPLFFFETRWRPGQVGKRDKRLGWTFIRYRRGFEAEYDTDELVQPARRLDSGPDLCNRHRREVSEQACPLCQDAAGPPAAPATAARGRPADVRPDGGAWIAPEAL